MMHLPREKKMSTCSDLLSPMVPDQGFVSPGEHLLSPCPPGDGDRSNFLASPMLGSDVNPLFVNPPSLQVELINHLQHFIVPMGFAHYFRASFLYYSSNNCDSSSCCTFLPLKTKLNSKEKCITITYSVRVRKSRNFFISWKSNKNKESNLEKD